MRLIASGFGIAVRPSCLLAFHLCLMLMAIPAMGAGTAQDAFLKNPAISPDGRHLLVRQGESLVVASMDGSSAITVAARVAPARACWSADGHSIVFSGTASGGADLYIKAVQGGEPRRLTHHEYGEFATDCSAQGLLFSSLRRDFSPWPHDYPYSVDPGSDEDRGGVPWIFEIKADGTGLRKAIPGPARDARRLPSGDIVYVRVQSLERPSRVVRSATTSMDLWILDGATGAHRLLAGSPQNEKLPAFNPADGKVYFLRDDGPETSVWKVHPSGEEQAVRAFRLPGQRISGLTISTDGQAVVEAMGLLHVWDTGTDAVRPLRLLLPPPDARERLPVPVSGRVTDIAPGEAGYAHAVVAGNFAHIELATGTLRFVRGLPGRAVALARAASSGAVFGLTQDSEQSCLWSLRDTVRPTRRFCADALWAPSVSPDGSKALLEQNGALKMVDLSAGTMRTVVPAAAYVPEPDEMLLAGRLHAWLPDGSGFLVSLRTTTGRQRDLAVVRLVGTRGDTETAVLVRSGNAKRDPLLSSDGRCLGWRSDQPSPASATIRPLAWSAAQLCLAERQSGPDLASQWLSLARSDIAFDRIRRLPVKGSVLSMTSRGSGMAVVTQSEGEISLVACMWTCEPGRKLAMPRDNVGTDGFSWVSEDVHRFQSAGEGLLALVQGELFVANAGGDVGRVSLPARADFDRLDMYESIFDRAVFLVNHVAYSGRDFPPTDTTARAYRARLPAITSDQDFADHVDAFLGELDGSHTYFAHAGLNPRRETISGLGLVWGEWSASAGGWTIADVLPGSPLLAALPEEALAGAVLMTVDGVPLVADRDPASALVGRGETIALELRLLGTASSERIRVRGLDLIAENHLHARRWQQAKSDLVQRIGQGRVAYGHLRGMSEASYNLFVADVFAGPRLGAGLVVDTRNNNGGWLHERLLAFLSARPLFSIDWRGHTMWSEPETGWTGPSAMLVNGFNYSNGTETPLLFRQWKIGELVGEPIMPSGAGGYSEVQSSSLFMASVVASPVSSPGGALWEGGPDIDPDVRVTLTAEDIVRGEDPQLERAVRAVLDRLPVPGAKP